MIFVLIMDRLLAIFGTGWYTVIWKKKGTPIMEQLENATSLDAFLSFGYSKEFEKLVASADLVVPPAGRNCESLTDSWFSCFDSISRWNMDRDTAIFPLSHPDPLQFRTWQPAGMLEHGKGDGTALFARSIQFSAKNTNERVFLRFGNIDCPSVFFLNGSCIACHGGNVATFGIEVTGMLREENLLVVAMDAVAPVSQDAGSKTSAMLVRTQPITVDSWSLDLDPRYDGHALSLDLWLSSCCPKSMRIDIPELEIVEDLYVSNGHVHAIINATPEIWTEENPKTYEVRFTWDDQYLVDRVGFKNLQACRYGKSS
jgi:hypothetical protein